MKPLSVKSVTETPYASLTTKLKGMMKDLEKIRHFFTI